MNPAAPLSPSAHPSRGILASDTAQTLLCVFIFAAAILVAHPYAEFSTIDDFSYVVSADAVARTGHIAYNGWAAAMLGWQLYVGAVMDHLFGFSFTAMRIGTMLVAAATVALTHRTLLRMGIRAQLATLGTVALSVSPIFLTLSCTFMSDIYSMFTVVSCLFCCMRALQSPTTRGACAWILAAGLGNALLGSCRQVAWLGVVLVVPAAIFLMRKNRTVLWVGSAGVLAGFVIVASFLRWFSHQRYITTEANLLHLRGYLLVWQKVITQLSQFPLESFFLILPIAVALLRPWRNRKLFWFVVAAVTVLQTLVIVHSGLRDRFMVSPISVPALQDWLKIYGLYSGLQYNNSNPSPVFNIPFLIVLNVLLDMTLLCTIPHLIRAFKRLR